MHRRNDDVSSHVTVLKKKKRKKEQPINHKLEIGEFVKKEVLTQLFSSHNPKDSLTTYLEAYRGPL